MSLSKKVLVSLFLSLFLVTPAFAQVTILPNAGNTSMAGCKEALNRYEASGDIPSVSDSDAAAQANQAISDAQAEVKAAQKYLDDQKDGYYIETAEARMQRANDALKKAQDDAVLAERGGSSGPNDRDKLLGCAIKTGKISLMMIPLFVTYFTNYLLSIVAIVCVLFVMLGGYFYIWGGLNDAKEKGKKFITNALTGLGIASVAWIVVNALMAIVTS